MWLTPLSCKPLPFLHTNHGTIDDIGLVRGDRESYHEAVKIVEQMPQWIPARCYGSATDAHFVLPVDFTND